MPAHAAPLLAPAKPDQGVRAGRCRIGTRNHRRNRVSNGHRNMGGGTPRRGLRLHCATMPTETVGHHAGRVIRGISAVALAVAMSNLSPGAGAAPLAGPHNVNTSRSRGNQNETSIVIDPAKPQDIVGTSNVEFGAGLIHVWSTDGGITWKKNVIADGGPLGSACCDSQLATDEFGNI